MKMINMILIALLLLSCSDKNDVMIIENLDTEYYTEEQVDKEPGTDEQIENLQTELKKIVAEVIKDEAKPIRVLIKHRVYLDKNGKIKSIKPLYEKDDFANFSTEYPNYEDFNKVTKTLADHAADWHFDPALKNDEPVNFRADLKLPYIVEKDGTIKESFVLTKDRFRNFSNYAKSSDVYFVAVEEMPSPVGGMTAIQEKITYPDLAKRTGVQGKVFVKAYINEEGIVDEVELIKGIGAGCDSVAMDAIMMTKFDPGKQRGKPVKVQVSIPIVFKLQ